MTNETNPALLPKRIPRNEFISAMKKGWEQVGWVAYKRGEDKNKSYVEPPNPRVVAACALGAAQIGLGYEITSGMLGHTLLHKIAWASNSAGSKEAAIAAVEALDWEGYE